MAEGSFQTRGYPPGWLAWSIWGVGALFYLSGFYQRVAPAVMTNELMRDFGIGGASLGNLSAFYYYMYVAMQIPTGLLADSWGPRRLLTTGAVVAALGSLVFGLANDVMVANLGRALIGGSVAVAFVVLLKLDAHWFPASRFALASGLALLCGVLGAVSAGVPLRLLIDAFGWRAVMVVSAVLTLGIAAATWLFVRDDPGQRGYRSYAPGAPAGDAAPRYGVLAGLGTVFKYKNTWLLFLAPGGLVGPVLAFAGLWGVPYLAARYGLPQAEGAAVCSVLMITWALGSPVIGGLSDRSGRRKPLYLAGAVVAFLCWAIMLYTPAPLWLFVGLTAVAGFATGGMIVGFAFAKESVPPELTGTVNGLINGGTMLGPTLLQPAMGWMLDLNWTGNMADGARIYDQGAYDLAFLLVLAWSAASCLFLAFTSDSRRIG